MRTRTAISTISYNSEPFLKNKLDDLLQHGHIDFYFYIRHDAESDEKKDHFHLWLIPSETLDTQTLQECFKEYVQGIDLPLKVMPFRKSNFQDAYLYAIHDKSYLDMKMEEKEFHYSFDDVVSSDSDYLLDSVHHIDWSKIKRASPSSVIRENILNGVSWSEMVCNGVVPAQQYSGWHKMYMVIYNSLILTNPENMVNCIPIPNDSDVPPDEHIELLNLEDLN